MTAKDIKVRLGEYDFTRSNETRVQNFEVVDIRVHLNFSIQTYEHDIAILKMDRRTAFNSYVWPVCLPPPGPDFENMTAIVTGKGMVPPGFLPEGGQPKNLITKLCLNHIRLTQNVKRHTTNFTVIPNIFTNISF
jgi:hypothetical protein